MLNFGTSRPGMGRGRPWALPDPHLDMYVFYMIFIYCIYPSVTGDHVPRILPCSHTLCEVCLEILIRENKLDCPECRVKYEATSGRRSFPQNKYIITHIKKKSTVVPLITTQEDVGKVFVGEKFEVCTHHGRELSLYCKEAGCQKLVCPLCKARFHKNHEYLDLDRCKPLMADIKSIKNDIQENKEKLLTIKREVMEKNTECIALILKEKEDRIKMINEVYDKLLQEGNEQHSKFGLNIDGKVSFLEDKIAMLDNLEENVNFIKMTNDDITNNMETIQTITQEFKTGSHIDAKYIRYSQNKEVNMETVEELCGQLESISLTEQGNSLLTQSSRFSSIFNLNTSLSVAEPGLPRQGWGWGWGHQPLSLG